VRSEKSDGSVTPTNSPEIVYSSEENIRASSPNEPGKLTYFEDGTQSRAVVQGMNQYDTPNDRQRRRRSSLQTKLDRHRRKKMEVIHQRSLDSNMTHSESHGDLTNDSMGPNGSNGAGDMSSYTNNDDDEYDIVDPNHVEYFPREKRHSWWNIFVPDNFKNRFAIVTIDITIRIISSLNRFICLTNALQVTKMLEECLLDSYSYP